MNLFKLAFPLTLVSSLRFFGLFVVMPVISVYALSLGATPLMVGLAVGGYALTQIIFQTPFGILADKFDKRLIIAFGLIIFALGSLICAYTDNIYLLVIGRLLQGCGAISSVMSALLADLTPEEKRTQAMAIMGGGISFAFLLSMLIGPFVGGSYGVKTLFWIATFASILALIILLFKIPKGEKIHYDYQQDQNRFFYLKDLNLWMMYISAFLQKALVNLGFVIIPLVLFQDFNFKTDELWKFYAPAGILGVFAMAPASILAEKYGRYKSMMITGIIAFGICFGLFCVSDYYQTFWLFVVGIIVFFIGFDIHEPIMQSLASKYPKASQRGSALGLLTTFGFLGSFLGAVLGGILYNAIGLFYLSLFIGGICLLWILSLIICLKNPPKQEILFLPHNKGSQNLSKLEGILDYYQTQDQLIIKYNPNLIQEQIIKEHLK
ncbi:MFS transporter [Helicobacter kayseriensis]|uniref:MFS transporter n=1 Tax=Helicobacter kayseriensis TaxID=2905877 RepID=UPI001E3B08A8|nr:MFS transporter [Helicobacter kayseriensis]MCE3047469.1 MFS transporter [Helicobacter kayseriensis]MCE3048798.1 MFS transporter [Helicobacter kayseriensis]